MTLREEALAIEGKIIAYRRHVHMNPELGFEEHETAKYICEQLDKLGVEYRSGIAKTGVVATIKGNGEGKRIMIRADMDALPIQEENDVEFKSKNDGKMHACGHDTHVACLLGATELLLNNRDKFKGTVDLLFQPAEEGPGGAEPMVKDGAIGDPENPHIDAAIALHVVNIVKAGMISCGDGPFTGSSDEIYITVLGKGGHASAPHEAVDPVYIASQINVALQGWFTRMFDPIEPVVFTVGKIEGGDRHNIISDTCKMSCTLRTLNEDIRDSIKEKFPDAVKNIARAFGGDAEIEIIKGYAVGVNDAELNKHIKNTYIELFGEDGYVHAEKPVLGSEDFYEFGLRQRIPVSMFWLDGMNKDIDCIAPNHSSKFNVDEKILHIGTATLAGVAISYLNSD